MLYVSNKPNALKDMGKKFIFSMLNEGIFFVVLGFPAAYAVSTDKVDKKTHETLFFI